MLWHGISSATVSGVLAHGPIMVKHKENSLWASEKLIRVFFHPATIFIRLRRICIESMLEANCEVNRLRYGIKMSISGLYGGVNFC